ncbi:hypothetical protein FB45DRAFT_1060656 [Roridomyces roridus]|uniref:Uncharacterized protein n=1 Tax=Roridomyces roridus TaxID=1738132 RepID=A0AAD7BNT8_9AGAR|nr:hypothetical protein FB45DRAFT_1060656 [Roridomyces roridus]
MSIRAVGIATAPAGVSPADWSVKVQALADKTLALPAASAISKYTLLIPSDELASKLAGVDVKHAAGLPPAPNTIVIEFEFASAEALLGFVGDSETQALLAGARSEGGADGFLFTVQAVVKNQSKTRPTGDFGLAVKAGDLEILPVPTSSTWSSSEGASTRLGGYNNTSLEFLVRSSSPALMGSRSLSEEK